MKNTKGFAENLPPEKSKGKAVKKPVEKPHFHGHRDRLRDKFRKNGPDALADYELLELLLFRSIPRRDTKPLAKQLLAEFGSLAEILAAPERRLGKFKGLGQTVISDLKLIHAAASTMTAEKIRNRTLLGSWSQVIDYCRTTMAFSEVEKFRVLFLDKKNFLITDEIQQTGTVDHTPVYPREVAKRAMELGATAILLVHNHPSGDPNPSSADVEMTKTIIDVLKPLGVIVHDHIIIARDGHASLKGLQLI